LDLYNQHQFLYHHLLFFGDSCTINLLTKQSSSTYSLRFLIFVRCAFAEANWKHVHANMPLLVRSIWLGLCKSVPERVGNLILEESKKQTSALHVDQLFYFSLCCLNTKRWIKRWQQRYARTYSWVLNPSPLSLSSPPRIKQRKEFGTHMPGQTRGIMKFSWDNQVTKFLE
jgi:hypothetical protein